MLVVFIVGLLLLFNTTFESLPKFSCGHPNILHAFLGQLVLVILVFITCIPHLRLSWPKPNPVSKCLTGFVSQVLFCPCLCLCCFPLHALSCLEHWETIGEIKCHGSSYNFFKKWTGRSFISQCLQESATLWVNVVHVAHKNKCRSRSAFVGRLGVKTVSMSESLAFSAYWVFWS